MGVKYKTSVFLQKVHKDGVEKSEAQSGYL